MNRDPGGFGPWSWLVAFLESAGTTRRVSDTDGDREEQERQPRELSKKNMLDHSREAAALFNSPACLIRQTGDGVSQRRLIAA